MREVALRQLLPARFSVFCSGPLGFGVIEFRFGLGGLRFGYLLIIVPRYHSQGVGYLGIRVQGPAGFSVSTIANAVCGLYR